ncbi:MAG: TetR/AcrR family transcriptional regulator [Chitinophagales bacterium]|jgi:AcrR family transcriptional regulator|nr:TetR/AcrR family transcriptional regulator [Chitinophagales bacterium]|tara:strand:- start:2348 stop:2947 length:600 start_codon:yes stop_codon:yes gene_type:complete
MGRNSIVKERKQNPKKRLEIIDGLIVFFKSHSLAQSNMDEIAEGLKKSKATLYKYFKSKEEMVDALINHKIEKIVGFVPILIDDEIPFFDRYEQSFSLLHNHISDITIDFMDDLKTVYPLIYKNIELLIDLAVRELAAYYNEGMERGVFNVLNAKMLSQIDFILFQTLTDPIYLKANGLTVGEAFQDFYNIRCQGLLVK